MALVKSGSYGSSPSCAYELHADQTGGSGNKRTVRITLKLKVNGSSSASRYGYPINWKGRINSSYSGWMKVKGTEYWYGGQAYRSFTWTTEVDVGTTSSKSIVVGFQTDMTTGSSSWETTQTGNFTVGQTIPPKPDKVTGFNVSGIFEEGQTQTLTWSRAARADHYKVWYKVWQLGSNSWSSWIQHGGNITGTSYSITHNNIGGNQFGAILYCISAYNAGGTSPDSDYKTFEHYGVRTWNGSSWVWGQMRVWNGSSWVKVVPRVWTGSAWKYT